MLLSKVSVKFSSLQSSGMSGKKVRIGKSFHQKSYRNEKVSCCSSERQPLWDNSTTAGAARSARVGRCSFSIDRRRLHESLVMRDQNHKASFARYGVRLILFEGRKVSSSFSRSARSCGLRAPKFYTTKNPASHLSVRRGTAGSTH